MQPSPAKAVQAEIITYLMARVVHAPPSERQAFFSAVTSAMAIWIAPGVGGLMTETERQRLEAGFPGRFKTHLTQLAQYSPQSAAWLLRFQDLQLDFEREIENTIGTMDIRYRRERRPGSAERS